MNDPRLMLVSYAIFPPRQQNLGSPSSSSSFSIVCCLSEVTELLWLSISLKVFTPDESESEETT